MTTLIEREARRLAQFTAPARISALSNDAFEGYASRFGLTDSAGDVVEQGAFAKSLRTRGPAKVRMLYQHFAHEPIGVWQTIQEDARGLYVRGRLVTDTQRGRECLALLGEGALNGLSIGFRTVRAKRDVKTGLRHLLEIELWEISVVTFPLLAQSQVTAVGSKNDAIAEIRRAAEILRT